MTVIRVRFPQHRPLPAPSPSEALAGVLRALRRLDAAMLGAERAAEMAAERADFLEALARVALEGDQRVVIRNETPSVAKLFVRGE